MLEAPLLSVGLAIAGLSLLLQVKLMIIDGYYLRFDLYADPKQAIVGYCDRDARYGPCYLSLLRESTSASICENDTFVPRFYQIKGSCFGLPVIAWTIKR